VLFAATRIVEKLRSTGVPHAPFPNYTQRHRAWRRLTEIRGRTGGGLCRTTANLDFRQRITRQRIVRRPQYGAAWPRSEPLAPSRQFKPGRRPLIGPGPPQRLGAADIGPVATQSTTSGYDRFILEFCAQREFVETEGPLPSHGPIGALSIPLALCLRVAAHFAGARSAIGVARHVPRLSSICRVQSAHRSSQLRAAGEPGAT